jgi:iron complex outermembrane recepter protein
MKRYTAILLLLFAASAICKAQISGIVTDTSGTPLPFVTISVLSLPDSAIVKGTISDETGKYHIPAIAAGMYIIRCSVSGYNDKLTEPFAVDTLAAGEKQFNIRMTVYQKSLGTVSVYGTKKVVEFKNGNVVVNVENSPLAKGNSVYDLILRLPGVSTYEDNIMIQGKTGVIVMIDNRPQRLTGAALTNLLKSMNADLVKSIEILKNPPVKYDATGTSGMINIKSKTVTVKGVTGTVFSSYSQGFYERLMSGGTFNYKAKKVVFYSSLNADYSLYRARQTFTSSFFPSTGSIILGNENIFKATDRNLNYKAGIDWIASKTDFLGIKVEGSAGRNLAQTNGRTSTGGTGSLGFAYLDAAIVERDRWSSNTVNLNYEHKLDTLGSSVAIVADYTRLPEKLSNDNINLFYDKNSLPVLNPNNFRGQNRSNSYIFSGRGDLVKVKSPVASFEAGLKAVYVKTVNNYLLERDYTFNGNYAIDTSVSNDFQYKEATYAAYGNYIRTIKDFDIQIGLRVEKTFLTGQSLGGQYKVSNEYLQFFPNIAATYKRKQNVFALNLTRRTDRPGFTSLNPFTLFLDQYTYQQGNPFLLPHFANRGEFTYTYKNTFSTSVAYTYTQNIMMQYMRQIDTAKALVQSFKNMKSGTIIEYSLFYQKLITTKWNMSVSGSFSHVKYRGDIDGVPFRQAGINYYGNLSNIITVSKKTKLEVNGLYAGPNVYGIVTFKPKWMLSLAVKTTFYKNKVDFTAGVDDVFLTFIDRVQTNALNQNWQSVKTHDTRRIKLSLNYKFGKMRVAERSVRASNEEEKGRLNH